jgi:DNA-binding response OmpR family regulator
LYLLQNPHIREAFFPSGSQILSPEPARPEHAATILSIADAHETRAAAAAIRLWWQKSPECFQVLRNSRGEVAGFYILAEWPAIRSKLPETDPVAHSWRRHLNDRPMDKNESALFIRRWLSDTAGESPSPVQAACWTDVKRCYLRLRPHVRRCYVSVSDLATYGPPTSQVGFQVVSDASVSLDGVQCHLAVLDFGPGSIDGWLSELVARELGVKQEEYFDEDARELVLDDARIGLTALESGVLRYLLERSGKAVSRAELLEHVWQQRPDSGSNVVDVVVRSLRSKLRDRARMISTVRGVGYRMHRGQAER